MQVLRESRTSSVYNKIRIKPEKFKSGFTTNAKREQIFFVTTAIKKIGSANSKQTYFYFWPYSS
jgi:hypothetical protein